jgi:hypothetical protein
MKIDNSKDLTLESLNEGIPTLTKIKADMLKEACIWCLIQCNHDNGVKIDCSISNNKESYIIKWIDEINPKRILKAYNIDDAVEYGAEALSLLLIRETTEFTAIERAARPSGIDYWLGHKNQNSNSLFNSHDARLEISGILKERLSNTIKNRIKLKLKQVQASNNVFPVFISIIEFSHPKAETVKKDAFN